MNQIRIILAASAAMIDLTLAVPSAAHPDRGPNNQEVREIKIIKADKDGKTTSHAEFVSDCGKGRKFESSSSTGDEKNRNVRKMLICSDPGESDEAWAKTLKDALARLESEQDMPADGKAQIIADLRSEIAKLGK